MSTTGKPPIASVGKIKQEQEVPGVKLQISNPHTRKLIDNLEGKTYGKALRGKSAKNVTQEEVERERKAKEEAAKKETESTPRLPPKKNAIKEIPTYKPPPQRSP